MAGVICAERKVGGKRKVGGERPDRCPGPGRNHPGRKDCTAADAIGRARNRKTFRGGSWQVLHIQSTWVGIGTPRKIHSQNAGAGKATAGRGQPRGPSLFFSFLSITEKILDTSPSNRSNSAVKTVRLGWRMRERTRVSKAR